MLESLFSKIETSSQMFFYKFNEILKNIFFVEHLWTAASVPFLYLFLNFAQLLYKDASFSTSHCRRDACIHGIRNVCFLSSIHSNPIWLPLSISFFNHLSIALLLLRGGMLFINEWNYIPNKIMMAIKTLRNM